MDTASISEQKDFYDRYWQGMKPLGRYKLMRAQWIANRLQKLCRQSAGNELKLLDLGCGDGRLAPFWQLVTGAGTYALELSPMAVKNAQQLFPSVIYCEGDATSTPYADGTFDIIVCQEVLEHVEHQHLLVKEAARILQKGGKLILTTPNKFYFDRRKGGNYSQQPIEQLINKAELLQLLKPFFNILSYETLIYAKGDAGIYRCLTNRYWLALLRKSHLEAWWKNRMLKRGYGLHMAVVCEKK